MYRFTLEKQELIFFSDDIVKTPYSKLKYISNTNYLKNKSGCAYF